MSQQRLTPRDYIEDLAEVCEYLRQFTLDASQESFAGNVMMQFSVIRCFEILGEASKQLLEILPDARTRFPEIPFKQMYALRNRYIHGYASIDIPTVWVIVTTQIPALRETLKSVLANWPSDLT
jgi:uncharacterized protein with HEPN domain